MSLELSSPTPPATGAAPEAPGRLGSTVSPQEAFVFLRDLGVWRDKRKDELDALDSAALASSDRDAFSRDMLVSMALWKAISDRYDLLEVTFDNGRVGAKEAERISALIWGRLDVAPGSAAGALAPSVSGALALSLPEACRLSDAMTSSLRARLSLEPVRRRGRHPAAVGARDRRADPRPGRHRARRDRAGGRAHDAPAARPAARPRSPTRPSAAPTSAGCSPRWSTTPRPPSATSSSAPASGSTPPATRCGPAPSAAELAARGAAIRLLEDQCVAAVTPAPTLAIPDVTALGDVPTDVRGVESYLRRLDAVSRALTAAQTAYAGALAERDELVGVAGAYQAQARATGAVGPDLDDLAARLDETFAATPTDVRRARALLAAYQAYVRLGHDAYPRSHAMSPTTSAPACTQPGCQGQILDGYCDVCGMPGRPGRGGRLRSRRALGGGRRRRQRPAPGRPAADRLVGAERHARATSRAAGARPRRLLRRVRGLGRVAASPSPRPRCPPAWPARRRPCRARATGSPRPPSARPAVGGSKTTRRVRSESQRLRTARLGAGLTTIPPIPAIDASSGDHDGPGRPRGQALLLQLRQPRRARQGRPARAAPPGSAPSAVRRSPSTPSCSRATSSPGSTRWPAASPTAVSAGSTSPATRNVSNRWVVLKGLLNSGDPDALAAAIAEQRFLAQVSHPHIVEIYNFVTHDDAGYIVMEYVGGTSLKSLLKQRMRRAGRYDPIPADQALAYIVEILPAFQYLHDLGLVYCDFKPDNLIQVGDMVKLIDLGGVRRIDDDDSAIFGTLGYQAPGGGPAGHDRRLRHLHDRPHPRRAHDRVPRLPVDLRRLPPRRRDDAPLPALRLALPAAAQGLRDLAGRPVRLGRRAAGADARRAARGRRRPTSGSPAPWGRRRRCSSRSRRSRPTCSTGARCPACASTRPTPRRAGCTGCRGARRRSA